jgi:DNA-directed RNA polymerase subunit beta'
MIKYLPVLPPNLRPIIKMQDNTIIISDLNYLYSEIININNKIKKFKELSIPEILMIKEKISLQRTIDNLINNKNKKKYSSNMRKIFLNI